MVLTVLIILVVLTKELNSKKSDWKLKVRISRLWDVESPKKRGFIIFTDMVLIDEEGAYVHASLRGEAAPKLRQKLVEGKIYIMKNFEVVPNKDEYRVVSDSKIMLNFQFDTFVKMVNEGENIIPKHRFDFMPFDLFDQRRNNFTVLSDIFGRIVDEFGTDSDKEIEIEDQGGKRVRVKLWSRCSIDYTEQKKKLAVENKLKIVTITSIMARDYNGFLSLAASSASKVYINLDINEVTELKTHIREESFSPFPQKKWRGHFLLMVQIVFGYHRTLKISGGNNEDDTIDIPKIHSQDMVCQKMDIQSIIDYCKTEYK
ncbi:replication protein A 70 kDa DNA-binding subunit D-like [Silene latifolia]|uniref:replication protein A 70 kDa DNA-binding subunit D-like n=1 Tax=Silene latifolia TaxID=37657 RepID=UPI003D777DFA